MVTTAPTSEQVADLEAFRARVRSWLGEHAAEFPRGSGDRFDRTASRLFRSALWDAGLLGLTLDPAYGGQGLTDAHQ